MKNYHLVGVNEAAKNRVITRDARMKATPFVSQKLVMKSSSVLVDVQHV